MAKGKNPRKEKKNTEKMVGDKIISGLLTMLAVMPGLCIRTSWVLLEVHRSYSFLPM